MGKSQDDKESKSGQGQWEGGMVSLAILGGWSFLVGPH